MSEAARAGAASQHGKCTHGDVCDDYGLLPASQLPEIIRTDWTRRAGDALAEPVLIVLPEPDPVVPAVLPAVEPAALPLPVLPVPAVPDVEPAPDVPAAEPAPAP